MFGTMACWQHTLVCMDVIAIDRRREQTSRNKRNGSREIERPKVYIIATFPACFTYPMKNWYIRISAVHIDRDVRPLAKML